MIKSLNLMDLNMKGRPKLVHDQVARTVWSDCRFWMIEERVSPAATNRRDIVDRMLVVVAARARDQRSRGAQTISCDLRRISSPLCNRAASTLADSRLDRHLFTERLMEGALAQGSRLRSALEGAFDAAWLMGSDGAVCEWNRKAESTFGWSSREALGRRITDLLLTQDQRSAPDHVLRACLEAGVTSGRHLEFQGADKDGRTFPLELSITRVDDVKEALFVVYARDASARMASEAALRAERERSQSVLDNMLDAFVLVDRNLRVLQVNKAALRMEDRDAQAVLGKSHEEIWSGAHAERLREKYRASICSQTPLIFEQGWSTGAAESWLEVRTQPTPEGLAIFYRDISKRRHAEEVLRASEARLRTLANVVPAIVWVSSADGRTEFLNDRWFEYTGASAATDPAELLHPEDAPDAARLWAQALAEGEGFGSEVRIRRRDGAFRWFLARSEPVLAADGRVVAWIGASVDIDGRRKDQERLELMVNELNHRVKNNLATVQAIAAQTFRGTESLPQARDAFTDRLMALAKAHDILTRQQWEGTQLAAVAKEALGANLPRPEALLIDGPDVSLGPNAALTLSMALHELSTNALKYGALSSPTGRVTLRWSIDRGEMLHLAWTETGGPVVTPPRRTGFGTRLLTRSLAAELHGVVTIEFPPTGVVCTINAQLDQAGGVGSAATNPGWAASSAT